VQSDPLPHVLMPEQKAQPAGFEGARTPEASHRKKYPPQNKVSPSQVVLNADEGIRAAYLRHLGCGSFVSLKEYYPQIDILFPEWLHVLTPDGHIQGFDSVNHPFQCG